MKQAVNNNMTLPWHLLFPLFDHNGESSQNRSIQVSTEKIFS